METKVEVKLLNYIDGWIICIVQDKSDITADDVKYPKRMPIFSLFPDASTPRDHAVPITLSAAAQQV